MGHWWDFYRIYLDLRGRRRARATDGVVVGAPIAAEPHRAALEQFKAVLRDAKSLDGIGEKCAVWLLTLNKKKPRGDEKVRRTYVRGHPVEETGAFRMEGERLVGRVMLYFREHGCRTKLPICVELSCGVSGTDERFAVIREKSHPEVVTWVTDAATYLERVKSVLRYLFENALGEPSAENALPGRGGPTAPEPPDLPDVPRFDEERKDDGEDEGDDEE